MGRSKAEVRAKAVGSLLDVTGKTLARSTIKPPSFRRTRVPSTLASGLTRDAHVLKREARIVGAREISALKSKSR